VQQRWTSRAADEMRNVDLAESSGVFRARFRASEARSKIDACSLDR
jgi:hypothetical protein